MRPWSTSVNTPVAEDESDNTTSPEAATTLDKTTEEMSSWIQSFRKPTTGSATGTGWSDRSRDVERNLGF